MMIVYYSALGYLKKITEDLKILRIYGQEIERKDFPVPGKVTGRRSKRVSAQLKADEDLKEVSLHHVIRSDECPFAEDLKKYDQEFRELIRLKNNATPRVMDQFNMVTPFVFFNRQN